MPALSRGARPQLSPHSRWWSRTCLEPSRKNAIRSGSRDDCRKSVVIVSPVGIGQLSQSGDSDAGDPQRRLATVLPAGRGRVSAKIYSTMKTRQINDLVYNAVMSLLPRLIFILPRPLRFVSSDVYVVYL